MRRRRRVRLVDNDILNRVYRPLSRVSGEIDRRMFSAVVDEDATGYM